MKNKISVIVPVYNTARYLKETLDSVLAQTLVPLEVVVVDDGSSDTIDEAVAPYLDRIVFIKKANGGISSAYNAGIRVARGEWIAFCDGDDFWKKNKLEEQSKLINQNTGFIFCNKIHFYESDYIEEKEFRYPERICREPLKSLLKSFFASPSTVMVRRIVFQSCGLFDETLPSSEDYDMWIRIAAESGYEFRFSEQFLTHKRIRNTSIQHVQGIRVLITLVFEVLFRHKNLFKERLHLSDSQFYWQIGYNYGYVVKAFAKKGKFRLPLAFLVQSFRTSLVSGIGTLYRVLFKRQAYLPWHE